MLNRRPPGTIGRGTWIDKLAEEVIRQWSRKLEEDRMASQDRHIIRVESGLGASGIPHVGSLGDAVRSYGVKLALEDMGYEAELLAYSDDMDGLRKVPEGFPESLQDDIAKPVSEIADPSGCYESYAAHMSGILLEGLDRLGIQYEHRRASDAYRGGLLYEQTRSILESAEAIGEQIQKMVGQDKFQGQLPYFVVCPDCGRIYTTKTYGYDGGSVSYECSDITVGGSIVPGCHKSGRADLRSHPGKLAWKVEFAARWAAFDVSFEAFGKDIMDSVRVNDWIAEHVLGCLPPHHARYEMFLDREGKKISKSRGNVVTAQDWLDVGTPQSLLLLMFKRIRGARRLDLGSVPSLMAEYDELEDLYFDSSSTGNPERETRLRGLYEYSNLLKPPQSPPPHINYAMLVELARIYAGESRTRQIAEKLSYLRLPAGDADVERLIRLAGRFADTHPVADREPVRVDERIRPAIAALAQSLRDRPDANPQDLIYEAAKEHRIKMPAFFGVLYQIILGIGRGPRLGPLISDMGTQRIIGMLEPYTVDGPP